MIKFFRILILAGLAWMWGGISPSQASHMMGSDIYYRCLGNGLYEVTVKVYRDCNGIEVSQSDLVAKCTGAAPIVVTNQTKKAGVDITGIDPRCQTASKCAGSSFPYGIEEHVWTMTLDLSNQTCCEWTLIWEQQARNVNITTGMANQNFYTTATLNKCVTPCNSSPQFTNPPVALVCFNQDFFFNNGALDTIDAGDSLSYDFAPALQAENTSVDYQPPYSYRRPMRFTGFPNQNLGYPGGIDLDMFSGDLFFRPSLQNQIGVIVIEVKEWRKVNGVMTVIGITRRDMQIIVINCPNNKVPKFTGPTMKEICANQRTCISIVTTDEDLNDTVRIAWNRGIPGATFTNNNGTVKRASGEVCWTPTDAHVSNIPYSFTVTAKDDACDLPGQSVRAYSFYVRETPKAQVTTTVLTCGRVAVHYVPAKIYTGLTKDWTIRDSTNKVVWGSNKQSDTTFLQPGKYKAILSMATTTPCLNVISDSFVVPEFVRVTLPNDSFVCHGGGINLISTTSGGNAPYEYNWYRMFGDSASASMATSTNYAITPTVNSRYAIQVKDGNGCYNWDSINVAHINLPVFSLGPDQRICDGAQVTLDAGNDTLVRRYLWSNGDTTRRLVAKDSNFYAVRVSDTLGCYSTDTMTLFVNKVKPEIGNNIFACEKSSPTLTATGSDSYQWYNYTGFTTNPLPTPLASTPSYTPTITQTIQYIVRGTGTYQGVTCYGLDTIRVTMNPLPVIDLGVGGPICENALSTSLFPLINYPTLQNGTWRSDAIPASITNNFFNPSIAGVSASPNGHTIIYRVTDAKGCSNEKSTFMKVAPVPTVIARDSLAFCADNGDINMRSAYQVSPANTFDGTVDWYSLNNNPILNNNLNKSDNQNIKLKINTLPPNTYYMVYRYTSNVGGCTNTDTAYIRVKPIPNTKAGTVPPVCWNNPVVNLNTVSGATPLNGVWSSPDITIITANSYDPSSVGTAAKFINTNVMFKYTASIEGCVKADSVNSVIRGIPDVKVADFSGLCIDTTFNLSSMGTPNNPIGTWSGPGVTGTSFSAADAGPGRHWLKYVYRNPVTTCVNADSFDYDVQEKPEIVFTPPPANCAGEPFFLNITLKNASGITWSRVGDGGFNSIGGPSTTTLIQPTYYPGSADITNKGFRITAVTNSLMSYCPVARIDRQVGIFPIPDISITTTPDGCEPLNVTLTAVTNAGPGAYFDWKIGNDPVTSGRDNLKTLNKTLPEGSYQVSLTIHSDSSEGYCAREAKPVLIRAYPKPTAAMAANRWKTTVALPDIQFFDKSLIGGGSSIVKWNWEFGDRNNSTSTLQNPLFTYPISEPTDTGTFKVQLRVEESSFGCWDTATGYVYIQPDITVFIPNAFTPNGYNIERNNRFFVVADGYERFEITIFNRWGEQMYQSNDINDGWDGKYKNVEAQQDVYVYIVKVVAIGGKEYEYYGTITLLR